MNLDDLKQKPRFFGMFIGDPGTGKTIQACSFPGPLYVFDCDNRMRPVINFHGSRSDITFDTYHRDYPKFASQLEYIYNKNPYATVVVDSLTVLSDMIILQSIRSAGIGDDKDRIGKKIGGVQVPSIEDFNMESGALTQVMDALRGLRCHVILTAHLVSTYEKDLKTKKVSENRVVLTAGKKIAAKLPTFFDEIYGFYAEGSGAFKKYLVNTQNNGLDMGKTSQLLDEEYDVTQNPHSVNREKFLWPQIQKSFTVIEPEKVAV
jgi:hypothetical protein